MWFYASAYSIARRNNFVLRLPTDFDMNPAFKLDIEESLDDETMMAMEWLMVSDEVIESDHCCYWMEFHENIYNLSSYGCRNIKLNGYYQSWRYFEDYESDIRRQFTFLYDIKNKALKNLQSALNAADNLLNLGSRSVHAVYVGVHIRLGDWKHDNVQLIADYLARAVHYFTRLYANVIFIVCSNDQGWSRNSMQLDAQIARNHSVWFSPNTDSALDMAILAHCNHSIITVGTYGWWSAFLAGGTTVYYEGSRRRMGSATLDSNVSHYFYPGWISL